VRRDYDVGKISFTWCSYDPMGRRRYLSRNILKSFLAVLGLHQPTSAISPELRAWPGPMSSAQNEGCQKAVSALILHSPKRVRWLRC
jgi:hypothetical protein